MNVFPESAVVFEFSVALMCFALTGHWSMTEVRLKLHRKQQRGWILHRRVTDKKLTSAQVRLNLTQWRYGQVLSFGAR